jgi:hypothetical protein
MINSYNEMACSGGFVDITPSSNMSLAGWKKRTSVFSSIADSLEANAIVLWHRERKLIFVQLDVLSVGTEIRRRILERLGERIQEKDLLLFASHTHFAPNLDCNLPGLGMIDQGYVESVSDKTASLIEGILSGKGQPARIHYGEAKAAHSINRRAWCWSFAPAFPPIRKILDWHPNPSGEKDETVRSFVISRNPAVTEPIGVLWNYACHPVGFYDVLSVSADYPGVVRRCLRKRLKSDIPVIFLPGFGGNIRPNKVDFLPKWPQLMIKRLINGPVWGRFNADSWNDWSLSLADVVVSAATERAQTLVLPCFDSHRISQPLKVLMDGVADGRILTYHLVRLGRRFVIIALSAEPVVEYASALRETFTKQTIIPVGYLDGVCCYLPTSKMLGEGGLEVFSPGFSLEHARFKWMISENVLSAIQDCYERLDNYE